jgi:hypothetical protein
MVQALSAADPGEDRDLFPPPIRGMRMMEVPIISAAL